MLPASASLSPALFLDRSDPARSTMLSCEVRTVWVRVKNVFNSMLKIAWERDDVAFMLVSLLWREFSPRLRIQNTSYNKVRIQNMG